MYCTLECVEGCFCPSGTVELGNDCVLPSSCPGKFKNYLNNFMTCIIILDKAAREQSPPLQCPSGKIFKSCGTACPLTCDNYKEPPQFCTKQCVRGCFCPPGTVELGDTCVAPSSCPGKLLQFKTVLILLLLNRFQKHAPMEKSSNLVAQRVLSLVTTITILHSFVQSSALLVAFVVLELWSLVVLVSHQIVVLVSKNSQHVL